MIRQQGLRIWRLCKIDHVHGERLIDVEATTIVTNKDRHNGRVYGWDNEYGFKSTVVSDFRASKYLVSNAEYLEFVEDGGYSDVSGGVKRDGHGSNMQMHNIPNIGFLTRMADGNNAN